MKKELSNTPGQIKESIQDMLKRLGFKVVHEQSFTHSQTNIVEHSETWMNYKTSVGVEVMETAGVAILLRIQQGNTPTELKRQPITAPFRTFYTNPEVLEALILEQRGGVTMTQTPQA